MNLAAVAQLCEAFSRSGSGAGRIRRRQFGRHLQPGTIGPHDLRDRCGRRRQNSARKGGPGITRSDLLVINKIDLAPYVGASLEVMERDAGKMRGDKPFVFTNLKTRQGLEQVIDFIVERGMLGAERGPAA